MKSERRHELEQNQLAGWLETTIEQIKPYTSFILLGILGVAVLLVAASWWNGRRSVAQSDAWDAYYTALEDPINPLEALSKVIEAYPRTEVSLWARATEADMRLQYGGNQLFVNRTMANQDLKKAVDGYLEVLNQANQSPLRERATFGLARAREAQGDLDEAKKSYEQVVTQWPKGAFHTDAKYRLDALNRPATKQFYDFFAKAEPKPMPANLGVGPEFSDKALPQGPSAPAAGSAKPADNATKPATDAKPAEAKK